MICISALWLWVDVSFMVTNRYYYFVLFCVCLSPRKQISVSKQTQLNLVMLNFTGKVQCIRISNLPYTYIRCPVEQYCLPSVVEAGQSSASCGHVLSVRWHWVLGVRWHWRLSVRWHWVLSVSVHRVLGVRWHWRYCLLLSWLQLQSSRIFYLLVFSITSTVAS